MATAGDSSDEENSKLKELDKDISNLRSSKKELFHLAGPINDELERIRRREQDLVSERHRITSRKHDRDKHHQTGQRLIELESQLKKAQSENVRLKSENVRLKQSLDQATKQSKSQWRKIAELKDKVAAAEAQPGSAKDDAQTLPKAVDNWTVNELEKQLNHTRKLLNETKEELNEMRQRLSEVQDRLTLAEEVTAATQQRALQDCDNSEPLLEELVPPLKTTSSASGSDVLRELYSELAKEFDARVVAANMYQRNALTLKELQSIQSQRGYPIEAAESLLNIILEQPDAVYLCFLDVLKHTDQYHVYERLVEGGYKDYNDLTSHTSIIRQNYIFLLDNLDAKLSGLVGQLYSQEVVGAVERDDIGAEMTSFRANEKLLSVLSRKSPQQFQLFLDALDQCGQQHVRNVITDRQPVDIQPSVAVSETQQVANFASQTDEDAAITRYVFHIGLGEMIYQLLLQGFDSSACDNVSNKLVNSGVIGPYDRQKIRDQESASGKIKRLLMVLREMSAFEFECFLTTLVETGQQEVAAAVVQTLHTVAEQGQNPLQYACVGQVVDTLPEGDPVSGVTLLAGEIYLLRRKQRDQVEVYDVVTYRLLGCLTAPNLASSNDITSCEHYQCAYISDYDGKCVHRLDAQNAAFTRWTVEHRPWGLSVNPSHNVLVTCPDVRKIKKFSSHGDLLLELTLPDDVVNPWHTIQTRNDEFVLCHGEMGEAVHRVCKISADGRHIVHSHGGQPGPDHDQYDVPFHLAVDRDEFVFVADCGNRRVRLLSPTLGHVRDIVSRDQLLRWPFRLYFEAHRRRLYVADDEWMKGKVTSGRVVVFSV